MEIIEFVKWCFRNELAGLVTLFVLSGFGHFILRLPTILKKKTNKMNFLNH
jgi:hypothetical protein